MLSIPFHLLRLSVLLHGVKGVNLLLQFLYLCIHLRVYALSFLLNTSLKGIKSVLQVYLVLLLLGRELVLVGTSVGCGVPCLHLHGLRVVQFLLHHVTVVGYVQFCWLDIRTKVLLPILYGFVGSVYGCLRLPHPCLYATHVVGKCGIIHAFLFCVLHVDDGLHFFLLLLHWTDSVRIVYVVTASLVVRLKVADEVLIGVSDICTCSFQYVINLLSVLVVFVSCEPFHEGIVVLTVPALLKGRVYLP